MAVCADCQREAPTGALFCAFCGAGLHAAGASEAAEALVGATLAGAYFLNALIGRGGMGDVYRATDVARDRTVVVKVLRRGAAADAGAVARFHREARAVARLSHPNSVALIDSGETETGTLYMVMELVPGATLAQVLSAAGPLGAARAVAIGAQVLAALAEAHGLGIIHRDLKPANVMVDPRDGADRVKVLDFGIATIADGDVESRLTQQGTVFGTPAYMSPEQIRGEPLDPRSDLYSVGVILHEILTGRLPFEAETPLGLAARHLHDPPPSLSAAGVRVDPALEALVLSALAKRREERPEAADAFGAALLACPVEAAGPPLEPALPATVALASVALEASPMVHTAPLAAPLPRWTRWLAWLSTGTVAAVLAALAIWGASVDRPQTTDANADPPRRILPGAPVDGSAPAPARAKEVRAATSEPPPAPAPGAAVPTPAPPQPSPAPPPTRPRRHPAPPAAAPAAVPAPPAPTPAPGIRAVRAELNSLPLPPATSGEGLLAVEASPWAEVFLDGQELGESPREVQLGAGRHHVRAVHPQLGAREARVVVKPGQRTVWVASFE
jgi:serine/threonine-protein kinase